MRQIEVLALVRGRPAAAIYPLLCDFMRYAEHTDAVRSVSVSADDSHGATSSWEVNFHQGVLRWTERDTFDPDAHTITFEQVDGDADHFAGHWALHDRGDGCLVRFAAAFDLGLPSLSELLEPIAEEALRHNIQSILRGLLGEPVEFISAASAA